MPRASDWARALLLGGLVLLPGAAAPLVGTWAFGVSGLLVLVVLVGNVRPAHSQLRAPAASALALLGGALAVASAASAISDMGEMPPYDTRIGFGWAALALGVLAAAAGAVADRRPVAMACVTAAAGVLGAVAISLYWINTWYVAAVPLWLAAAVLRVSGASRGRHDRPG